MNLDNFFGAANLLKAFELTEHISQNGLFDVKNTGISYKTINHWDKHDLLVSRRTDDSKWRKFSFVDFVWLKIIEQFRSIGTSIPILQKVKTEIFQKVNTDDIHEIFEESEELVEELINELPNSQQLTELKSMLKSGQPWKSLHVPVLQVLICETIFDRIPISLIVFTDGHWFPWYQDGAGIYSDEDRERTAYQTHVVVSITEIIKEFLTGDNAVFTLPKLHLLTETEVKLLEIIHSGEYESITIHFRDRKAKSVEMVKAQDVKRRIVDILSESAYQEIIIKSHQGMVSTIKNTIKMKLS